MRTAGRGGLQEEEGPRRQASLCSRGDAADPG